MLPRALRSPAPRWVRDILLRPMPAWKGQAIAVAATAAATLMRFALSPLIPHGLPFLTFFPAALVATLLGGSWAGVTAILLSLPIAAYFWLDPGMSFALNGGSWVRLIGYCLLGALLIVSIGLLRLLVRTLAESEERALILAHEMTHRTRNVLGLIQAISRQTFQTAADMAQYETLFEARLVALGRAQELLVENPQLPTDLRMLLDRVLAPFDAERFGFAGDAVGVPHEIGATLALLFHELATNSLKYGALSVPDGKIRVAWKAAGGRIRLDWQETGGPLVEPPQRSGFGTKLMKTAFAPGRGEAAIDFAPTGVECRISFPAAQ